MVDSERAAFVGSVLMQTAALGAQFDKGRKDVDYEINSYSGAVMDEHFHAMYPGWWCDSLNER